MDTEDFEEGFTALSGQLLVASPKLVEDANFGKTVVLMVQHNDEGAFGLVLNRPDRAPLREIWDKVADTECSSSQCLHVGGPVPGPLMVLHTHEALSELEVVEGVFLSVRRENIEQIVETDEDSFRVFLGYSGWAPGQLESELSQQAWLTAQATSSHVFECDEDLWERVAREIVSKAIPSRLIGKHVPPDPSLN